MGFFLGFAHAEKSRFCFFCGVDADEPKKNKLRLTLAYFCLQLHRHTPRVYMERMDEDWSMNWDWRAECLPDCTPSARHLQATEVRTPLHFVLKHKRQNHQEQKKKKRDALSIGILFGRKKQDLDGSDQRDYGRSTCPDEP